MAVRTPDPDPNESGDEGAPRDSPRGLSAFGSAGHPMGDGPEGNPGWLSDVELAEARRRLPILYVEAVPVRTDGLGAVTEVGILLRATPLGEMTRTIVSGRVRYGETVRDALFRHLENDLGPMAFPLLPPQPVPFTVAEYFPMPGLSRARANRVRTRSKSRGCRRPKRHPTPCPTKWRAVGGASSASRSRASAHCADSIRALHLSLVWDLSRGAATGVA